jgi:hypothetical protein
MLKILRLPYGLFLAAAAVGLPYVVAETLSRSRARNEFSPLPWQGSNAACHRLVFSCCASSAAARTPITEHLGSFDVIRPMRVSRPGLLET